MLRGAEACTRETVDHQGRMIQLLTLFSAQPITPADGYEPPLSSGVGQRATGADSIKKQ
jgi:hypothetical protein